MRPSKDETWLTVAHVIAKRGTCARRQVGCVLVDAKGDVLSTGYNGVARGMGHCTDTPCDGVSYPSGQGLDKCAAIHAEQNALMQCRDVQAIDVAYITVSPCLHCVKMLMNTGCRHIVFAQPYTGSEESQKLWEKSRGLETIEIRQGELGTVDRVRRLTWLQLPVAPYIVAEGNMSEEDLKKFQHPREFGNISW